MKKLIKDSNPKQGGGVNLRLKTFEQTENHTCGLCSCSSLYRFYGLDLRRARLRVRLGVDNLVKGTLPFDLFAVLHGDGFDLEWYTGPFDAGLAPLKAHLRKGHPALALFGAKLDHWIAVGGYGEGGIRVADSAGDYAFRVAGGRDRCDGVIPEARFASHAMGILLVRRKKNARPREMGQGGFLKQYLKAVPFSVGCLKSSAAARLMKG